MGLLDILNGMQNGPRGQRQAGTGTSGGMSPITVALLGLLAYKAVKSFAGASAAPASPAGSGTAGGGLGDILGRLMSGAAAGGAASAPAGSGNDQSGLGSLLGGAAAGTVVSNGLGNLIKQFQEGGYGRAAQSWVGTGPNEEIAPNDLANALGADTLDALTRQTGMKRADLLSGLSQHLPELVDQLTPNGRLPTEEEASRIV
jgi:uncharacterized protein YidB (DUF937 family)